MKLQSDAASLGCYAHSSNLECVNVDHLRIIYIENVRYGTAVDRLNNLNIKYKVNVRKTKKIFKTAELTLYKQPHFKILPTGIIF